MSSKVVSHTQHLQKTPAQVTEAYSGSESRDFVNNTNSGTPTGAYRQSYQYNQFNQVTQQTNRLWSDTETTSTTFTNNRMAGWSYDAAGFLIGGDGAGYTRDAAGRNVHVDSGDSHGAYTFDGNGHVAKTALTHPGLHGSTVTNTTYYLTSTVLGSVAVAELGVTGQRLRRYVYAGARKLAEEAGGNVTLSHQEPVTGSRGDSTPSGSYFPKAEFDADGINVGLAPPDLGGFDVDPIIHMWGSLGLGSACSVGNPNCVTCYIDYFESDCGQVQHLMELGNAAQCPNNDCGPHWNPNRDGPGWGGFEIPWLVPGGFSYEPIGPSTRPPGTRPPTLRPAGSRPPHDNQPTPGTSGKAKPDNEGPVPGGTFIPVNYSPLLPQKTGVEFLRDTGSNHSYDPSREDRIEKAITSLYTAECTKAFEALGLESPISLVNRKGVVVGPSTLAQDRGNAAYIGIPERSRAAIQPKVGSSYAKAFSVRGELTSDGRGRTLLNYSAFSYGLVNVFAHEFIHLAGVEGVEPPVYKPWQDDLSFDNKYQAAIDACVNAAKPFNSDAK